MKTRKEINEIIENNFNIFLNSDKHPDHYTELAEILGCNRAEAKTAFYRYLWAYGGHMQTLFVNTCMELEEAINKNQAE